MPLFGNTSSKEIEDGKPRLVQLFPKDGRKGTTTIDIIAVHGIETQSPRTWIAYEREEEPKGRAINWLCDENMLPSVIPQARIWAYNYNSKCYSDNAQEVDILGLGESFLQILWVEMDKNRERRPLVLIGSCFGGIVVAQALETAFRASTKYADLLNSIAGVVFLGTPLRGTEVASAARWIAYLRRFFGKETSETLLRGLEKDEGCLDAVIQNFAKIAISNRLQVRCFYETRRTQVANAVLKRGLASLVPTIELVPKQSACLDGHKRMPLDARHAMMNKFRGPYDGNFILVSSCLKELIDDSRVSQSRTDRELDCLRCLSSNYREDKDRNEKRVPGTCEWVLGHPKFLSWRQEDSSRLLWVSADPGCGKSALSRALVDEGLLTPDTRMVSTCYFFFKDDDTSRQSGASALCAVLHQLFIQKPALLKYAMRDFENNGQQLRTMFPTLWDILEEAATDRDAGEIVCLLDALDECKESARNDLIRKLSCFHSVKNSKNTKLKFLATSRPYSSIEGGFRYEIGNLPTISLRGEDESDKISKEINLVIDHQVPRISNARRFPLQPEVQNDLLAELKNIPHRTYLWVHLILDEIRRCPDTTKARLKKVVDKIPQTVDEAYEKILKRIDSSDHARQARRLLHIIVAAVKPLNLREMNIALTIDEMLEAGERCQSYNELDIQSQESFREKIRNLCGLFVAIIDSRIYLIHQTAREFLVAKEVDRQITSHSNSAMGLWKHSLNLLESNFILTRICVSYLLLPEIKAEEKWKYYRIENDPSADDPSADDPSADDLLYHAALNWTSYCRGAQFRDNDRVLESIIKVCDVKPNRFLRWLSVCWSTHIDLIAEFRYTPHPLGFTNLMITSNFGLSVVVKLLLSRNDVDVNAKDKRGQTALSLAAKNGHTETVRLLICSSDIDVNAKDKRGQTALSSAAKNGHTETVRLLLRSSNNIEVNAKDKRGQTALSLAAKNGHTETVGLLIASNDIDVNARDNRGQTTLSLAAHHGHTETVRLLITRKDVDVNVQDDDGQTVLSLAVNNKHTALITLLFGRRSRNDTRDWKTQPWLSVADIVKLLLSRDDIKVNNKDRHGRTALLWAAREGYIGVVKLLLSRDDIEVTVKDYSGETLWSWARELGDIEIIELLSDRMRKEGIPCTD